MVVGVSVGQARQAPLKAIGPAGRDLGAADLDSDSDRSGTGERSSAGVDASTATDQKATVKPGIESAADEFDDPDALSDEVENKCAQGAPAEDGAT